MKEIRRNVMSNMHGAMETNAYAVDAEIVVEDEGQQVYLHAQMTSEAPDMLFEAHTTSIYGVYYELNHLTVDEKDFFNNLLSKRDRIDETARLTGVDIEDRYIDQYEQLVQMVKDQAVKDGMEDAFFDLFEEDDEDYE